MQEHLWHKRINDDVGANTMQEHLWHRRIKAMQEQLQWKNIHDAKESMMQKWLQCKNICHAKEATLNKNHINWMMKHKHDYNIKTIKINPQHNGATRDVEWQEIMCNEAPLATTQYTNDTNNNIAWPKTTTTNNSLMCKEPTIAKLDEEVNNQTKMEELKWPQNHKNSQRSNNSIILWSTTK